MCDNSETHKHCYMRASLNIQLHLQPEALNSLSKRH